MPVSTSVYAIPPVALLVAVSLAVGLIKSWRRSREYQPSPEEEQQQRAEDDAPLEEVELAVLENLERV
jgi:predicted histidine transporter YuiF (NhaC family)